MQQDGKTGSRPAEPGSDEDWVERASALLRIIAYARDEAVLLSADFPAYCLDASLAAVEQELAKRRSAEDASPAVHSPSDCGAASPLH